MRFCDLCDNMLYIKLGVGEDSKGGEGGGGGGSTKLTYACKNCGFVRAGEEEEEGGASNPRDGMIIDANYMSDVATFRQYVTPYIKHDPTLPRVNNIPCPNAACTRAKDASPEVIYVKYDVANLKFLYHCTHCAAFWKTGGGDVAAPPSAAAAAKEQ